MPTSADRELVVARLSDAFAQDRVSLDELDRLTEAVFKATSLQQLVVISNGLQTTPSPLLQPAPPTSSTFVDRAGVPSRRIVSILSSVEHKGLLDVPALLEVHAVLASIELDLSQSRFAPGITVIDVSITFASLEIRLPSDVAVENDGTGVFGNFVLQRSAFDQPSASAPMVRITGRAVFGSVEIKIG